MKRLMANSMLASSTWLLMAVTVAHAAAGITAPGYKPSAAATEVSNGRIKLDGKLNQPAWQGAPVLQLVQQDPHPGEPTAYVSTVRVLADHTHLYFGITCIDPIPRKISVYSLERDSDQKYDDHITIVLDTLGTQRLGYVFQVNAGGARTDGLISPASPQPNYDWDGIWNAKVRRTVDGWTAEISIDIRGLQTPGHVPAWGLNIQRYVPRDQLNLQWAGISLDASIFDLSRMGRLYDVVGLEHRSGLQVTPYALARYDSLRRDVAKEGGGDMIYNLTPGVTATLTLNPDFAEAEADTDRLNLTPYALFFPEKRRFFSEDANIFAFGAGLVDYTSNNNSTFVPFYSRSIGLAEGETVRLDSGLKVAGSAGRWTVGVLGVHMGQSDVSSPTNLYAGRITYDVDEHLRVGKLVTRGDPSGNTNNAFFGVDAVWHTATFRGDKNLVLSGWAGDSSDSLPGRHSGWGAYATYPNDLWSGSFSFNLFGDALDPAMGFLPRPGTRQYDFYISYNPRPRASWLRWARQFFYQLEVLQVDDLHGNTQTRRVFTAPINVDTPSDAHFEFDWIPEYEALSAPFEIAKGVVLPVGGYRFIRYHFEAQSPTALPWQVGNVVEIGNFYDGRLTQIEPFVYWSVWGGRLRFELNDQTNFGYLHEGNFIQRLDGLNVVYSFSPDLTISVLAQHDSDFGHTGINARLHWIVAPGRDFFLVFNHGLEAPVTDPNARTLPVSNGLIAKLVWDFRQ